MNQRPNPPPPAGTRMGPGLLYLTTALLPFLIGIGLPRGVQETQKVALESGLAATISQIGVPPEYAWILPRVLWLLGVGVLGLLAWRDLGLDRRKPFLWLWGLYLLAVLASALLAEDDWNYKLLGGVGRMDGVLYQVSLGLWATLAYLVFLRVPQAGPRFLGILAAVGGIETLVLVLQRLGYDFIGNYYINGSYPVTVGTVGHPGMAAGLLLASFFSAAWWAYRRQAHTWLWLALTLWISIGIGVTTNKSTTLAIALVLAALIALLRRREPVVLLTVFLLGSLVLTPLIPNRLGFARSLANPHTGITRLMIWRLAGQVLVKTPGQPFIGAGPDGFLLGLMSDVPIRELLKEYRLEYGWPPETEVLNVRPLFNAKDPPRSRAFLVELKNYPEPGKQKKIIYRYYLDKAHNLFLDRAVDYGVAAALLWLALFWGPLVAFLRRQWADRSRLGDWLLFGGLAALFLYYLAWFPVPQVEPLHVAFLALAWVVAEKRAGASRHDRLAASSKETTGNPGFGHP